MAVAINPLTTMPSRNSAGSRKRSDLSIWPYTVALRTDRIPGGPDLVADPPHGHDRRGLAELPPQLTHMDVHRPRVAGEGVAPDAFDQLAAREHDPAVTDQHPQQIEFKR